MIEKQQDASDGARIDLSPDEALVLFELLSRWCEAGDSPTPDATHFESPAECRVLHGLLADLQKQLAAPFRTDYAERLGDARTSLAHYWDWTNLRE